MAFAIGQKERKMNDIKCAENLVELKNALENYCGLNEAGQEVFEKAINALLHKADDAIGFIKSARSILWDDCNAILRENTSEELPVLYPETEAKRLFDKNVEKMRTLSRAIYILEDMRKDGKL